MIRVEVARTKNGEGGNRLQHPTIRGGKFYSERNDRQDSNQRFTACKTAPFRNIASSVAGNADTLKLCQVPLYYRTNTDYIRYDDTGLTSYK
uniref:Uncharacterized protein n=1 Tax=Vespula pensylvanica TaxID=30213 RepID=A0A834PDC6_VESPE|nr:hypothetical protein H0235_000023 [Vespula pensylvanica]